MYILLFSEFINANLLWFESCRNEKDKSVSLSLSEGCNKFNRVRFLFQLTTFIERLSLKHFKKHFKELGSLIRKIRKFSFERKVFKVVSNQGARLHIQHRRTSFANLNHSKFQIIRSWDGHGLKPSFTLVGTRSFNSLIRSKHASKCAVVRTTRYVAFK